MRTPHDMEVAKRTPKPVKKRKLITEFGTILVSKHRHRYAWDYVNGNDAYRCKCGKVK
jgi:uncharacterized protein YlbG (UPF0298 family)